MFRGLTCLLVSGVVSLAACGDDGNSPEPVDELTMGEVEFLASEIDATFSGVLDDFFDQSGGDPAGAPALTHEAVVWERTFTRDRPCHDGGTLAVTGGGTTTWDAEAGTKDIDTDGTKTRTGCEYTQADGVGIPLNGNGTWTHERHYLNNAPAGTWITTYIGSYTWLKPRAPSRNRWPPATTTLPGRSTRTRTRGPSPAWRAGTLIDRHWRPGAS